MTDGAALQAALQASLALGREMLALLEREHRALTDAPPSAGSAFEFFRARLHLMPRLDEALRWLRRYRAAWERLPPEQRHATAELSALLRANQDLMFRILMLDRENQQLRLRQGLAQAGAPPSPALTRPSRNCFSALA